MNIKPNARQGWRKVAQRLLGTVLGLGLLGAASTLDVDATPPPVVPVDQQPLTLQPPIPPNIMLMIDDSGSMAWDYMPDACYLQGVTCTGTQNGTTPSGGGTDYISTVNNSAMIDASNNGVYYNPTVTYTPPPLASGGNYPAYTNMTSVPINGFNVSTGTRNLANYSSSDVTGEQNSDNYPIKYSYSNKVYTNASFNQVVQSQGSGYYGTTYADQVCQNDFNNDNGNGQGPTFNGISQDGYGDWLSGTCIFSYIKTTTYRYFQYALGPAAGPWVVHYVAPASQGCGTQTNCVVDSDTSGTAAPAGVSVGQNIANWFAYYHTRVQMAKSGLMTAFSTVNKNFRVGFGSIDGGCNGDAQNLPSYSTTVTPYTYKDSYNCGQGGSTINTLAAVQPFGDGSSGTDQKNGFWNWAAALTPSGGTPLREALNAVGTYYTTSQPWSTMSSDPASVSSNTEIACRQSYTIMTTDGFWNESNSSIPSPPGNADNTQGPTIKGPNGQTYTYTPTAPYMDGNSNTLADVAMEYWENDLQPNIAAEVPTSTQDPAFWQHMVTFTMGLGFTPVGITPTGTTVQQIFNWASGAGPAISNFGWPTPSANSLYNIADLAHAGVDGHGGFYSATSPQSFASGLSDALHRAAERVGTGASLAANSTQLNNGTVAYQANYYTSKWIGDLKSLPINSSTGVISTTPSWTASAALDKTATVSGNVKTFPNRLIVTYNPTAAAGSQFVAFQNNTATGAPPALSAAELSALGSTATAQEQMVNYLRGDNTLEQKNNGPDRNRDTPLGDIVDSQPVYSGAPNPNEFENQTFSGTDSFQAWSVGTTNATTGQAVASAASQRETMVFVAGNDGMLHAFDANTGTETYAYLPGAVITAGLSNLANPAYGSDSDPHQYYNDGELTIADAYLPSLPQINGSSWHTILVGTTGRGLAEAVYALDITDPTHITPLWERSGGDGLTNSNYIGQMVGKPVIVQVADGNWQVLIGNGYNSQAGQGALLEFNLATGLLSVHTTDATAGNGLAAPVTWMDDPSNGISMEAYAGDLFGRVWMFPLDDVGTSGHGSSATTTYSADLTAAGTLEFTATDPSGAAQPITAGMTAGRDPVTGNVWVFFGTGRYLSATDLASKQVQSWYGLIVQPGKNQPNLPALPTTTLSGNMVQRSITYEQAGNTSASPPTLGVRTVTTLPTPSDMGGKLGWYMNLEQPITDSNGNVIGANPQGERMVTPSQFQGNLLLATTRIPVVTDICNPSGGGWVMAVNPFTGTNPSGNFFMANGGSGSVTINGKAVPVAGVGFSSLPNNPIFVGGDMLMSFDNGTTSSLMTSGASGTPQRVSWQELVNP